MKALYFQFCDRNIVHDRRALNLADADLQKALLEASGIDVMIKDDLATQVLGVPIKTYGVKLLVRAEDVEREVLSE